MPAFRAHRLALPLVVAASALALVACSAPSPAETPVASGPAPSSPAASPSVEASAPALPDPTCENIIGEASFTELDGSGWEYQQDPFAVGTDEIPDGISCTWTNPAEPGGNILVFGWAPVTAEEAGRAEDALERDGWVREEGTDGVYLTEDPAFAMTVDEAGYGMTYFFGEGYVHLADVKQGLLVIERR